MVASEISGVQLNRLLVMATRIEPNNNPAIPGLQVLIESEFSKLARLGTFSFSSHLPIPGQSDVEMA